METFTEVKRAGDIMIPLDRYPHLPYWFTLRQAMVEFEKAEIEVDGRKSLPRVVLVFNEQYQMVGMVRRRDVLRGLEPKMLVSKPLEYRKKLFDVKVDPNLSELSYDKMINAVREQAERPVSEVMQPIVVTVDHEDHLIKIIYEMVDKNLSLLPVLKDRKLVGVVRSVDVFHQVATFVL